MKKFVLIIVIVLVIVIIFVVILVDGYFVVNLMVGGVDMFVDKDIVLNVVNLVDYIMLVVVVQVVGFVEMF